MPSKRFEDVHLWSDAHRVVLEVYALTARFPQHEQFGLTSQLRRSAVSIPANFVEGFKKRTLKEKLRFYNIAQGSVEETRYYLILAMDLGYGDTTDVRDYLERVSRALQAYMQSVERSLSHRSTDY